MFLTPCRRNQKSQRKVQELTKQIMSAVEEIQQPKKGPVITFPVSPDSELQVPVQELPLQVRILFNTLQERRQTIDYLNQLCTKLTEANGVDSSSLSQLLTEFATANPQLVVPTKAEQK